MNSDKERRSVKSISRIAGKLRRINGDHDERHRPSGFQFAFADRVEFLNGAAWDAVTEGGSLFLRRETLRVMELHGPENVAPRYAMLFRESKPVAVLAAQWVTIMAEHFRKEDAPTESSRARAVLQRVTGPVARAVTSRLQERMLVAGNLVSWGFHGIAFAPGEDPREIWPGIADALYRIRRAARLEGQTNLLMVKDITDREPESEVLGRYSYRAMETEPNMVLAIDPSWRSYEDYLAALDAKYRRNSRDQLKKLAGGGCAIETLADLAPEARRLHQLYLAVHRNASVKLVTLSESFLPALAEALGDDFRCTVIRRAGEIIGFVTVLRDGETAVAYYIGFDRDAAQEGLPIYLRLLHSTIATAIEWRCRSLSLGRTALEPKAALGAKPERLSIWCRHRIPALNLILRGAMSGVSHDEAPVRNPFKTAVPSAET